MSSRLTPSDVPRMHDIARAAGVSVATVSRALMGSERVAAATRARIEDAARSMGYVTNSAARSLRTRRTNAILIVVPDIGNPFFSELLKGIEAEAHAHGYSMLIGTSEGGPERLAGYARHVLAGGGDGLILLNGRLPELNVALPPTVIVAERIPGSRLPTVRIDNEGAARMAVDHLLALGHRRIAHIAGPSGNILTIERRAGYERALDAAGITVDEADVVHGDFSIASGARAADHLLGSGRRPTALFCSNDEMAVGAINAVRARGLAVPADVSVVGFDDIGFAGAFDPPLTTIRQPRSLIGATGMRLMARLLAGEAVDDEVVLPVELIIRASTARRA